MSLPRNQLLATLVITLAVIAALIVLVIRWPFLAGILFVTLVAFRAVSPESMDLAPASAYFSRRSCSDGDSFA